MTMLLQIGENFETVKLRRQVTRPPAELSVETNIWLKACPCAGHQFDEGAAALALADLAAPSPSDCSGGGRPFSSTRISSSNSFRVMCRSSLRFNAVRGLSNPASAASPLLVIFTCT